ncbi:hypothetical protein GBA52_020968 [Prunus armeniaca]|nr:hypothetical protein GBA52_020968 [Prunus armeniaca]
MANDNDNQVAPPSPPNNQEQVRLTRFTLAFLVVAAVLFFTFPSVYSYSLIGLAILCGVSVIITQQNPYLLIIWGGLIFLLGSIVMLLTYPCPCPCVH